MKFKTKKDLYKEENYHIHPMSREDFEINSSFNEGVRKSFESFNERFSFYKRYRYDGIDLLQKEQLNVFELWKQSGFTILDRESKGSFCSYNDWLLNHCFEDMIK